jgi:hypothetical protein
MCGLHQVSSWAMRGAVAVVCLVIWWLLLLFLLLFVVLQWP